MQKINDVIGRRRYRHIFFDEVGHDTTYASSANKHFFTKKCLHQSYQNYDQSTQKLGIMLENKVLQKSKLKKNKSWSPSPIFFAENYFWKDLTNF